RRDYVQTLFVTTDAADPAAVEVAFRALEQKGDAMLDGAGVAPERRRFERSVDARYRRPASELALPGTSDPVYRTPLARTRGGVPRRNRLTYGQENRAEPVQIVSLRVAAIGRIPPLVVRDVPVPAGADALKSRRKLWFRDTGAVEAAVYDRRLMAS